MAESNKKPDRAAPESTSKADDVFNIERISRLIELMKEHNLGESTSAMKGSESGSVEPGTVRRWFKLRW